MDKNNIKNLLNQTFVNEAKVPGLEVTNKAKAESGKENKKAVKDMEDELSDYDKASKKETKDATKPVKFNYTDDSEQEYHQEMEIMNGQEMIQYDRTPSELYKKRAEDAIAGANYMGNSPDWANVVIPGQGGDPTFGKKLVKAIKASAKKRSDNTPTSKMFGDDWEIVQDKSHKAYAIENTKNNKETINESEKMKRLKFKKPFNGVNNALKLIPENYRVDNKVFEMTDGNESYKVRWEGSLNEGKGVVLMASDATLVNEDVQKMKHLMGYNSKETFGNLKGAERLAEDKNFGTIWSKTKTLLSEGMDEWSEKQLNVFDKDKNGIPFQPEDMEALRKDEGMYEMDMPGEDGAMGGQQQVLSAAKIRQNFIEQILPLVQKMSPIEKTSYNETILAIAELFSGSGNQDTGQIGVLINKLHDFIDKKMASTNQQQAPGQEMPEQPSAEAPVRPGQAMPVSEESPMDEMDRFDEVFSGIDEDDTMEEGRIGNWLNKQFGIDKEIESLLSTPEGQEIVNAYNMMDETDFYNNFKHKIARLTSRDDFNSRNVQSMDVYSYLKKQKENANI